ncbi:melanocortin-2 receptor accessory protein [Centrocercus urophasianus]|uniref:Melanocortin 2 receptor accessory protein n=2 Tax=Phasianidae TaxID=9005 RepID=A0A803YLD0_MELGA|nr:melanocortin-2 receptor accessory protein [Meleagris gallopavo]XP_042665515.1 melanocortin-2 receptor accessory protein [Centrocercus urophasianus]XP_052530060.1 melanocortin-2 receptor accessory protein [Tympanuchus pallidicinctus]
MANRTNSSEYFWSYEYYWDYIDPIPVDGRKLKVNKYSIVIAFWVGLAAFVMFLFLILLYMSRSGSNPVKQVVVRNRVEESSSNSEQPHCDNLSSPFPDLVAPGTPSCLPDDSSIHGSMSA